MVDSVFWCFIEYVVSLHEKQNQSYGKTMDRLPNDPMMLISSINMLLRDGEFDSLEDLCAYFERDVEEVKEELQVCGYTYDEEQKQIK